MSSAASPTCRQEHNSRRAVLQGRPRRVGETSLMTFGNQTLEREKKRGRANYDGRRHFFFPSFLCWRKKSLHGTLPLIQIVWFDLFVVLQAGFKRFLSCAASANPSHVLLYFLLLRRDHNLFFFSLSSVYRLTQVPVQHNQIFYLPVRWRLRKGFLSFSSSFLVLLMIPKAPSC